MEYMGIRAGIRAGTELCALGVHSESMTNFLAKVAESGLTEALQQRDEPFGDYRTSHTP
jgi:enoyl-CoA hydratase